MKVLVATDGSKYGRWELNWVATLPFVEAPRVTVLHVLDSDAHRASFIAPREIQRMEARAANTLKAAKQQLAALKLKGTVRKEQGAIAPTILKRAPNRDGLLVVGSQGLDALDRFLLGSVSTKLSPHRPYFDPSIATSTFMLRILLFEFPSRSNRQAETGCEMPPATAPRGPRSGPVRPDP